MLYLPPGEKLESGIQNNYILAEDEGLLLQSTEEFIEETPSSDESSLSQTKQQTVVKKPTGKKKRKCGERWMILGPYEYVPPTEVRVLAKRYYYFPNFSDIFSQKALLSDYFKACAV